LECLYAAVDALMVIPYDNTVEGHPVRMLLRTGCKSLNIRLGMRAACSIPFEISVAPGREDVGKYNVRLNVNDEDAKLLEYLQEEISRLIMPLKEVLEPIVVSSGISKTGKPYPPRVNCRFDIDRTKVLNVETDGKTAHDGNFGDIKTRSNLQLDMQLEGLEYYNESNKYKCVFLCSRVYMLDADKEKGRNGFPIFNKVDTFTRAASWDLSGGHSPISRKMAEPVDKEANVSSGGYSKFDPSEEAGPHHFANTSCSDVETDEEDEEELIRTKKRTCRFVDVDACNDY
jgi:hypothetical protein